MIRTVLAETLRDNYDVIEAAAGYDGLNLAREEAPDLIILDIMLPDIGGWEVFFKLKEDTDTSRIPVIISTAKGETRPLFKKRLGTEADGFLVKPYQTGAVTKEINRIFSRGR